MADGWKEIENLELIATLRDHVRDHDSVIARVLVESAIWDRIPAIIDSREVWL